MKLVKSVGQRTSFPRKTERDLFPPKSDLAEVNSSGARCQPGVFSASLGGLFEGRRPVIEKSSVFPFFVSNFSLGSTY